jgi:hypothetical protein
MDGFVVTALAVLLPENATEVATTIYHFYSD